mgnify:CR=1 FL=1
MRKYIDADDIEDIKEDIEDFKEESDIKYVLPSSNKFLKLIIFAAICLLIGGILGWSFHSWLTKEEPVDVGYISGKLADNSELTTQTITYTSRVPMSSGAIPFINKKSFVMVYTATLRAGVDLSDVDVKKRDEHRIVIKIPHATIQGTPNIDPTTIDFIDEKKSILSWNKKEDVAEALAKAKEDVMNNDSIDITSLLTRADEHAEELIHALLDDVYDDCEVIVKFK